MSWSLLLGTLCCGAPDVQDLALPEYRERWLAHPVLGDPSFDGFERIGGNPIYRGTPPYEWPVNGSLFRDPKGGHLYCYVSLYPKGYWPAGPTRLLKSEDAGASWRDLGLVLTGDKRMFDGDGERAGATCDATVAADDRGYHMAYGWAKPDNSDGGIAYAFSKSPEGPFERDSAPIHAESKQTLLPPGYKRVYASTLIRRAGDWLILASMSTPGNGGGMWAFVAMTAPDARGPYGPPVFLRAPQQGYWQPQPIEFFPAFVHEGHVYAPLTSVAANRGYQVIYRAPLEEAHRPESWEVWADGSVFHAEPHPWETYGIWGQSFSGLVEPDGRFLAMFPSRDADGNGAINLASRPWREPYRHGFVSSAPNAPALALVLRRFLDFRVEIDLESAGTWRFLWDFDATLGPDRCAADARIDPETLAGWKTILFEAGHWQVLDFDYDGQESKGGGPHRIAVERRGRDMQFFVNDEVRSMWRDENPRGGGIGLWADAPGRLAVTRFAVDTPGETTSWFFSPIEGLLGAGERADRWRKVPGSFRAPCGFLGEHEGARAKWSFRGCAATVWGPRGPEYGAARVFLDGTDRGLVSFRANAAQPSAPLWRTGPLEPGPHAVLLVREEGALPVDAFEFHP